MNAIKLDNRVVASHKNSFKSLVVVAFQNVFYLKIHQNNIFLFFKNYF